LLILAATAAVMAQAEPGKMAAMPRQFQTQGQVAAVAQAGQAVLLERTVQGLSGVTGVLAQVGL
jgi:hypothetical protein